MRLNTVKFFWIIFLIDVVSLAAVDIKSVFQRVKHPLFIESIRPFIHSNFWEPEGKRAPIIQSDIDRLFDGPISRGTLDLKNHYIQFERDGAMGIYTREYVLYFSEDKLPIFVGSEQNSSLHEKFTSIFALCQQKDLSWVDCTFEIFPKYNVTELLKPGQKLNPKTADLFWLLYKLPQKGTDIELEIACDDLTFHNKPEWADMEAARKAYERELAKFSRKKIILTWDKPARRFKEK